LHKEAVMKRTMHILAVTAALLLAAPAIASAQRGGPGHGHPGRGYHGGDRGYSARPNNYYRGGPRYYAPPPRAYYNPNAYRGYVAGRFYPNRGYFYAGGFYARPYFGIGVAIPFGYGYATDLGCGYYDGWGRYHPAPCYYPNGGYYYGR
jgi:hypothetical protein